MILFHKFRDVTQTVLLENSSIFFFKISFFRFMSQTALLEHSAIKILRVPFQVLENSPCHEIRELLFFD